MIVISSTKLAKSLNGRAGAGLPSTIPAMVRPEPSRNSAGPVPELDYRRSGVCHQTAAGHGDVESHDAVHGDWNRVPPHRRHGGLGETERHIRPAPAAWSAVIAANAVTHTVTNADDEEVACAIACVRVFGSVAILAHPVPTDAHAWIVAATTSPSIALAAIGLETNIGKLTERAFRPAWLGTLTLLFIAGFSLTLIKLME
jgi:hypothetical protein